MDYIEINGYKSIKKQKVNFSNINILIGANGSGKSNFLSFFEFINRLYNKKLNEYISLKGGEDKFLFNGKKITNEIAFKIIFYKPEAYGYSAKLQNGENGLIVSEQNVLYQNKNYSTGKIDVPFSPTELWLEDIREQTDKKIISLKRFHFHDTGANSPFTKMSHIENDIFYLYEKGDNLAAFLYNIKRENSIIYQRIIRTIQSIVPYFSDFFLQPNSEKYLRLHWKDKYSDVVYGVNDLSDGTIRFIALTTLFMQPNLPNTIIIDEPELGLHPAAVAKLAGMIKSVASKNCQVILATQSTDLISHFQPEDVITVDSINGESVFKRLDSESLALWLEDYTIDDLWKRNIITSGQPNFLMK